MSLETVLMEPVKDSIYIPYTLETNNVSPFQGLEPLVIPY